MFSVPERGGKDLWPARAAGTRLQVRSLDDRNEPAEIVCEVVDRGRLRDFFGFNRAKHAVLEAAILATRTEFLPAAKSSRNSSVWLFRSERPAGRPSSGLLRSCTTMSGPVAARTTRPRRAKD